MVVQTPRCGTTRLALLSPNWSTLPLDSPLLRQPVCSRVAVYWDADDLWYGGTIQSCSASRLFVRLDDPRSDAVSISVVDLQPLLLYLPPSLSVPRPLRSLLDSLHACPAAGCIPAPIPDDVSSYATPDGYRGVSYTSGYSAALLRPWQARDGATHLGTFGTALEAARAVLASVCARGHQRSSDVSTHHRGMRLHMSTSSRQGATATPYVGVFASGPGFRAAVQQRGSPYQSLGTYPTAVEAAYAYARYQAGYTRTARLPTKSHPADQSALATSALTASGSLIQLHLAPGTVTGYRGVRVIDNNPNRVNRYRARLSGGRLLGSYATALDAAVAYAEALSES